MTHKASSSTSKRKINHSPPDRKEKKFVKPSEFTKDVDDAQHLDVEEDVQDVRDKSSYDDLYDEETTLSDGFDPVAESDGDSSDGGTFHHDKSYSILSEDDIRQRQEENVTEISSVLSVSREWASLLLRHHNWNIANVHEAWFADEEKVRNTVGLMEKPVVHYSNDKKVNCGICFENYRPTRMHSADCGHLFCTSCWQGYISTSINDGSGCLILRCPDPSCSAAVGQAMINTLVSDEDKEKYSRHLLRSYVEANKKMKWCPAPSCEYAVDFEVGGGSYDVTCKCTCSFCWNCLEEVHRPVDCDTVAKWILKNTSESENVTWILANSKPCPKCKRPIEKNHGCMHMTCTPPCKFQFCWLCLGSWAEHGRNNGGFYACNTYETTKKQGVYDKSEEIRQMAKKHLEKYTHYYERWATNHSSRQKAIKDLQRMQGDHIEKLSIVQCQLKTQLKFITDAWLQIIECRRVLKWTYAYGYFLPEHEHVKRQLFEYLQGEAESGLERLHKCAEFDLKIYLNAEEPLETFNEFRTNLAGLTTVTRNYFKNLVRALENGLADVDSGTADSLEGTEEDMKKMKGKRKKGTTSISRGPEYDLEHHSSWTCEHCTYYNDKAAATVCQMCNRYRVSWSCGYCTYMNGVSATVCAMCNEARLDIGVSGRTFYRNPIG